MNYSVKKYGNIQYIQGIQGKPLVREKEDILDFIAECGEHNTNKILFFPENLPGTFFDLKSREAGFILQKFSNYHIQAALVIKKDTVISDRFHEMAMESNKNSIFGVFYSVDAAEKWFSRN